MTKRAFIARVRRVFPPYLRGETTSLTVAHDADCPGILGGVRRCRCEPTITVGRPPRRPRLTELVMDPILERARRRG